MTLTHKSILLISALLWQSANVAVAQVTRSAPNSVAVSIRQLAAIDDAVAESINNRELPGAVVLANRKGQILWHKAYGARAVEPRRETMTTNTIFDLASLTKVVATATSIMILVERGKVRLHDPVSKYLPDLTGQGRERITIEHLLTHVSGYAPDFDLKERWTGYDEAMKRLDKEPLRNPPGTRFVYSDIGYIALGEVVRRVSGLPLDQFAARNIFSPLGMRDTSFNPRPALNSRIAPTERRRGQLSYLGDTGTDAGSEGERWLRGQVHDPTSYRMNGVAGHAGLFSTASDLAIYCRMIMNGGQHNRVRILGPLTVAEMVRPRVVSAGGAARGLGWDIATTFSTNRGDLFPLGSFGHTGFTGTSMWLDPASETFAIFLSNRVHPDGKGDVAALRGKVSSIVAGAVEDIGVVEKARKQLQSFFDAVTRDQARFIAAREQARSLSPAIGIESKVLTGVDVLERDSFRQLAGMRVGLVTNHTGRNRSGRPTIDVIHQAADVKLVALFSPEHGIRGLLDDKVADDTDEKTGLPIYSLYGETRRPRPEHLKNLDALVYDIQDIGARFYTYISTLGYVMEEAAKAGVPVFVLDRPNPIGGVEVEGPIADTDKLSFTAYHTLPVRHGMTVGELAQHFNREREINCDLRVVKMEGWHRGLWYDATNLIWVNPSPNMRSLTEATLYPGIGLLETTNLSVGRGTDTPFEVVGAPWLDGQRLAEVLNNRRLPGVRFVPLRFTPRASVFKGEECSGINIIITDRETFRPVTTGIEVAVALRRLYPTEWKVESYGRLLVNADTLGRVMRGEDAAEIAKTWTTGLDAFRDRRRRVLLYN